MMYSIHHFYPFPLPSSERRLDTETQTSNPGENAGLRGATVLALRGASKIAGETPSLRKTGLREKHMEARAARGVVLQANRAAMVVHDFRDDGKTETYSVFLRREKWIENLLAQFGRHAGAGIFDDHAGARFAVRDFLRDRQAQCF